MLTVIMIMMVAGLVAHQGREFAFGQVQVSRREDSLMARGSARAALRAAEHAAETPTRPRMSIPARAARRCTEVLQRRR